MTAEGAHGSCGAERGGQTDCSSWQPANHLRWKSFPRWHHLTSSVEPQRKVSDSLIGKNAVMSLHQYKLFKICETSACLLRLFNIKSPNIIRKFFKDRSTSVTQRGSGSSVPAGNFHFLACVTSLSPLISEETRLPGNRESSSIIYSLLGRTGTICCCWFWHQTQARTFYNGVVYQWLPTFFTRDPSNCSSEDTFTYILFKCISKYAGLLYVGMLW